MTRDRLNSGGETPRPSSPSTIERRSRYEQIIQRCEPDLLRAARRMSGNEDLSQDLVQNALIRGYQAFIDGRFVEGTNERAWLMRILTNGFITEYHRSKKWISVEDVTQEIDATPQGVSSMAQQALAPHEAIEDASLDEPVERALQKLSPDFRACVVLVDIEEMSYAEAAAALGAPVGTVRSRLSRARIQLHALLFDYARNLRRV